MTEETKKTTTKKTRAKKDEETQSKTTNKTTAAKSAPKKRTIKGTDEVWVYNNTNGKLKYSAKKGNGYLELQHFMDSDVMTVEELQQMRNGYRKILENGWIYVDDEEVLDHLRLGKVKESVKHPDTLEKLLDEGNTQKIIETLEKLTNTSKETFYSILTEKYLSEEFGNVHTIKAIEEALGIPKEKTLLEQ